VTFTVQLDKSRSRIAAMIGAGVVSVAFVWLIISNFIIRVAADPREELTHDALIVAASRFPNSARINYRLANSEVARAAVEEQFIAEAEIHAARAVNSSPWDYQARHLLAIAQELNGKQEEAENTLRAAVKLAPNHAEMNWALANLLLRRGKLDEANAAFRAAAAANPGFLESAIEMVWRSSGENSEALKSFARTNTEMQLQVVRFLTDQMLTPEAVSMFNTVDKEARVRSPRTAELIASLIKAGQVELARSVWIEAVTTLQPAANATGALVWNGGFEHDAAPNLGHFDWVINPNQYARIVIDRNSGRSGSRSLKVVFSGLDTTTMRNEVRQLIVVKPGGSYRLECYVRSSELVTPEGPRVAIAGNEGVIATSDPAPAGSTDWQRLSVDFTAGPSVTSVVLTIVRIPKFSYDDPTRGTVWFDDFTLREQ
jgi:tetratricopeptide (TPR) repeat protein